MKTVQVALRDSEQANSLRDLLTGDGAHQVHLVEQPDMGMAGVIVMDLDNLPASNALTGVPERVVVVASKANDDLARAWKAGVRRVVFYGDDPGTLRIAVLATELTLGTEDL
ncbi:MAG TPA: hypothetical protein VME17_26135 [Bryobacteraceae bacterium]|nr:hypothetical protein [Bryobacteraceae bacterium]